MDQGSGSVQGSFLCFYEGEGCSDVKMACLRASLRICEAAHFIKCKGASKTVSILQEGFTHMLGNWI